MTEKCNASIFEWGYSVCTLDACKHRAELWVQAIARESGELVDWHYTGGIANVLYIGDYAKVAAAVEKLAPMLAEPMPRKQGECGSCDGDDEHRPGVIHQRFDANAFGPFRSNKRTLDRMNAAVVEKSPEARVIEAAIDSVKRLGYFAKAVGEDHLAPHGTEENPHPVPSRFHTCKGTT